jgi:hypothetical protein
MYLTDVLTRIVNGHPNSAIDQLLPGPTESKTSEPSPENDAYGNVACLHRCIGPSTSHCTLLVKGACVDARLERRLRSNYEQYRHGEGVVP